ncbi:uncharacterized protein LOC111068400 [Drosophila obscura]|uniref:uncharacterized protein LOC111068400 n=1 Tax=Drosophila obscura TaxID=7282 RepID=UPI001BB16EBB|nr:uncharacterized protein LOC111068400 [Drosophila obscura]
MNTLLMLILVMVDALVQVHALNCSTVIRGRRGKVVVYACGANGCCAKGCVWNGLDKCVVEECTSSLTGWLRRPVTVSCYFHWFLLLSACLVTAVMTVLALYALGLKLRNCLRARFNARYRPIRNESHISFGSTPC